MRAPRLYIDQPLHAGSTVRLEGDRAHYLRNVLRLNQGHEVHVFNAQDGEWRAQIGELDRRGATLEVTEQRRVATPEPGPSLLFAPIRRNRLDWMIEKAVELGVAAFHPILTEHTVIELAQPQRLMPRIIEAAEQCERLTIPTIASPKPLAEIEVGLRVLFADEAGDAVPLLNALDHGAPCRLLVGPEGGFSSVERAMLRQRPDVTPVCLGPLILRAETAAVFMLSCWRAAQDVR